MAYPRATPVYTRAYDLVLDGRRFVDLLNTECPDGRSFSPDTARLPNEADQARLAEQAAAVTAALGETRARPDLAVSIVLPQAGSLGGYGRKNCLFDRWLDTAILVTDALVAAGASVEIIGYTTVGWKGGKSAAEWKAAGRPEDPGRLCDLLHIVYKAFDEAWTPEARRLLDLGARTDYMRENVDGEAYDFAAARLLSHTCATERAMLIFSKQRSMDNVTIYINYDKRYLQWDRAAALAHARKARIGIVAIENDDGDDADFTSEELRYASTKRGDDYDTRSAALAVLRTWLSPTA